MVIIDYIGKVFYNTGISLAVLFLPSIVIAFIMQKFSDILRNRLASVLGVKGWVYLTAPGVMIHELSHALFCIIFRHKILDMELFNPREDGTLGYVNHAWNPKSLYQRIGNLLIGTGPIWGGCAMLALFSWWLLPDSMRMGMTPGECFQAFTTGFLSMRFWGDWHCWVWLYLAVTTASHITLSPPDLKGAADGAIVIVIVIFIANLFFSWHGTWAEQLWHYELMLITKFFIAVMGALIVGLTLITLLFPFRKR